MRSFIRLSFSIRFLLQLLKLKKVPRVRGVQRFLRAAIRLDLNGFQRGSTGMGIVAWPPAVREVTLTRFDQGR
jgi:hypothetical protein